MSAHPSEMRLLPWTTPEGRPCYVPDGSGWLSDYVDAIEVQQLIWGHDLLERSAQVLKGGASETELRFLVERMSEALRDALRVAERRGERVAEPSDDGPSDDDGWPGWTPPAEASG